MFYVLRADTVQTVLRRICSRSVIFFVNQIKKKKSHSGFMRNLCRSALQLLKKPVGVFMRKYFKLDNCDSMKNCDLPTSNELFGAGIFNSLELGALSS